MTSIFDGGSLTFCPQTAKRFGLNEAIIIQRIHHQITYNSSIDASKNIWVDRQCWFFCSFTDWAKLFCFIPEPTIKKNILGLEKLGVVVSCVPNQHKRDQTKAYRINIDLYEKLMVEGK